MSDINLSDVLPPMHALRVVAGEDVTIYEIGGDGQASKRLAVVSGGTTGTVAASAETRTYRVESATGDYTVTPFVAPASHTLAEVIAALGFTPMNAAMPTFPSEDPAVAGAWWDNNGVLTKSSGT